LQSENRQGSAIVNAVSVRTGCNRAIVIPTIEVGNKESVNDCVAESVILNKYHQHGTISKIIDISVLHCNVQYGMMFLSAKKKSETA
jgi:hypothetical protein